MCKDFIIVLLGKKSEVTWVTKYKGSKCDIAMGYMRSLYILRDTWVDFSKVLGESELKLIMCYDSIKLKAKPLDSS